LFSACSRTSPTRSLWGDAGERDDSARRGEVRRVDDHLADAGALDHDVGIPHVGVSSTWHIER
jgi:hypothetical protein